MRVLLLCIAVVVAVPVPARAESNVIALLPLAADKKLALYGQPVASELAHALEQEGYSIVVVTSTAPVPSKARLVIDGRIVDGDGDTVLLEARVRDPKIGKVVSELSASAPSLTRIDEATAALARQLDGVLAAALAPPKEQPEEPAVETHEERPAEADRRPIALVSMYSAVTAGKDDPVVEPLLHAGSVRLAKLVGYRSTDANDDPDLKVHIELLTMKYEMGGVITARARAHVLVTGRAGTVFDRVIRTDTVVGGRGDRRDAVARAAIDQIVDIAMPRVREKLEKKKK